MPTKKKPAKKPAKGPRVAQRNKTARRKSKPQFLTTRDGEKVWITTATLQDVKEAQKLASKKNHGHKRQHPFAAAHRQYLVTVPSPSVRNDVYQRAADALRELEERVLPPYGGRPWTVLCKVTDPTPSSTKAAAATPYFSFVAGRLELAAWPHMVDKMPVPPSFPGFGSGRVAKPRPVAAAQTMEAQGNDEQDEVVEEEELLSQDDLDRQDLQEREISDFSQLAYDERWRIPLAHVSLKWISPLHEIYTSRKSAWEAAVQLCKHEVYLDKVLAGYTATGKPVKLLPSTIVTKKAALQAGRLRFQRDGLWILGQEEDWQLERLAEAGFCLTPPPETVAAPVVAPVPTTTRSAAAEPKERRLTGLVYYLQCMRKSHRNKRLEELTQAAVADAPAKEIEAATIAAAEMQSKVTHLEYTVETAAAAESIGDVKNEHDAETQESCCGEPKIVPGEPVVMSTVVDNETTKSSSLVIQESTPVLPQSPPSDTAAASLPGQQEALTTKPQSTRRKESVPKISFTMRDAETELRVVWKTELTEEERQEWNERAQQKVAEDQAASGSAEASGDKKPSALQESSVPDKAITPELDTRCSNSASSDRGDHDDAVKTVSPSPPPPSSRDEEDDEACSSTPVNLQETGFVGSQQAKSEQARVGSEAQMVVSKAEAPRNQEESQITEAAPAPRLVRRGPSKNWVLGEEQIKLCFDAGTEHFDQIMRTVSARDLTRELQDGFDLLRERGRGRYDMEIPAFDQPEFQFLTDCKKAPWMPVVREILGKDVALIHKGMFLSLPGAEPQKYHQDGVHLTTQYQKPCHAVNVFVPLVDLSLKNGPTEFCRGTHILDQEDFDYDFLVTPLVEAGTPIIFDYRLGHRGLGNTSESCRPIVYCTYARAADGKEFKDSINFSRKRYHKIGDLVSKVPSREERLQKRGRGTESSELERAIAQSLQEVHESSTVETKKQKVT